MRAAAAARTSHFTKILRHTYCSKVLAAHTGERRTWVAHGNIGYLLHRVRVHHRMRVVVEGKRTEVEAPKRPISEMEKRTITVRMPRCVAATAVTTHVVIASRCTDEGK